MPGVWWEKTVEYAFVVAACDDGKCDFVSPLAGKHEKSGGDAVFAQALKFVLIEFKRSKLEIKTEESLFHNYNEAKSKLQNYEHHHFVFGVASASNPKRLELAAETYFGRTRHQSALACLDTGLGKDDFHSYLKLLYDLKKPDRRGSGGHVSPGALSTVLGVSKDGKIVSAQSLYEHSPDLFPVNISELDRTPRPSPRMRPS